MLQCLLIVKKRKMCCDSRSLTGDEFPHPLCNPLLGYGLDIRSAQTAPLITNQKIKVFFFCGNRFE